jgi:hypothetical protein
MKNLKGGNKTPKMSIDEIMKEFGVKDKYLYNITVNQKAIIDNEWWELDLTHIAVFQAIKTIISYGWTDTINDKNGLWYNVPEYRIIKLIPVLGIKNSVAIYNRIVKLIQYELIERNPENSKGTKKWIRLGKKAERLEIHKQHDMDL